MTTSNSIFALLLAAPMLVAAQTAEKTMLKSFNLDGKDQIQLALPGTVDLKKWDNNTVKIEITVSIPNGNTAMLNELANVGRYDLTAKPDGTTLLITATHLNKIIKIKGMELKETFSFQVFAPKNVDVKFIDADATAAVTQK